MLKLKEVDPDRVRVARAGEEHNRGNGKTIARLLHIFINMHEFNVGKSYLYIGENQVEVDLMKHQFEYWLAEGGISAYQTKTTVTAAFKRQLRRGLMGWWDVCTKPVPPNTIEVEFMCVELGEGKLGTKQVDEVIVDVSEEKRNYFFQPLAMAMAKGKKIYV